MGRSSCPFSAYVKLSSFRIIDLKCAYDTVVLFATQIIFIRDEHLWATLGKVRDLSIAFSIAALFLCIRLKIRTYSIQVRTGGIEHFMARW